MALRVDVVTATYKPGWCNERLPEISYIIRLWKIEKHAFRATGGNSGGGEV